MQERETEPWFTVALVLRVEPRTLRDLQDVVTSIPGVAVVFKRISKAKLYITAEQPPPGVRP